MTDINDYLETQRQRIAVDRAKAATAQVAGLGLFDGKPLPHNGTETSREAAETMVDAAQADRWRVLRYVVSLGDRGATREEIELALNMTGNSVRPRVWECIHEKEVRRHFGVSTPLLAEPGHRRLTLSGSKAMVLLATLEGIQMAREGHKHAA